jgi:hypothetical protein
MADDQPASVISLHQPQRKQPKTAAERARDCRARKNAKKLAEAVATDTAVTPPGDPPPPQHVVDSPRKPALITTITPIAPSDHKIHATVLQIAALALAAVGITMNGWFARSLGSSEIAGWLFLAIGVASDLVALAIPACAVQQWHAGNRATATVAWVIWFMPFVFAVTAGIGFASVNITDVTLARASRETPAIVTARNDLADAVTARDRECAGGVGRFCRQRADAVTERRRALEAAMRDVVQTADPQTEAATRIVTWVTGGLLKPTGDDFAMVRLVLLALLPQIGGVALLIGREAA